MSRQKTLITATIIIEHPHDDLGYDGPEYHQWVLLDGDEFHGEPLVATRRDSLGRRTQHGWKAMRRLLCNNPDCKGRALLDPTGFDL